ncbi:MAG TPA: class I SAM-dependent methyltransferase [Thermoleophilaceae bacterium]|nr:class I SAM-dependent methyltransferase [Thermoleophilaceae bacterium]
MRELEKTYYDRRAGEYDDWWLGTGLFAGRERPGWDDEVARLIEALTAMPPARTLDVACGTAFLSRHLRGELTLLDQSAAMLAVARGRVPDAQFVRNDVPPLPFADESFERVFTSHFYGHLREPERAAFVAEARRVAGELVVVDAGGGDREKVQARKLNDGSEHTVYKRWFSGPGLAAELGGSVLFEGDWFVAVRT